MPNIKDYDTDKLESLVNYYKLVKLSRGLTDRDYKIYDKVKMELNRRRNDEKKEPVKTMVLTSKNSSNIAI